MSPMSRDWMDAVAWLDAAFKANHLPVPDLQKQALDVLARKESWIVCSAPYSSGKSSLLNALLGRLLLPTALSSGRQETGVPSHLRSSATDYGYVALRDQDELLPIPLDLDMIRYFTELLEDGGVERAQPANTREVVLGVYDFPLPPTIRLTELPGRFGIGLKWKAALEETVAQQEHEADVVVWLTRSRKVLPESEWRCIETLVRKKGMQAVVILVNVLVNPQEPRTWTDTWSHFLTSEWAACNARLQSSVLQSGLDGATITMLPIAALPLATAAGGDFGRERLIECLMALTPDSPAVAVSRCHRVSTCLAQIEAFLQAGIQKAEQWEEERERYLTYKAELSVRQSMAARNAAKLIQSEETNGRAQLEATIHEFTNAILAQEDYGIADYYESTIRREANKVSDQLARELETGVHSRLRAYGFRWHTGYEQEIRRVWQYPAPEITVPDVAMLRAHRNQRFATKMLELGRAPERILLTLSDLARSPQMLADLARSPRQDAREELVRQIHQAVASIAQYWGRVRQDLVALLAAPLLEDVHEASLDPGPVETYPDQWREWASSLAQIREEFERDLMTPLLAPVGKSY